MAFKILNPFYEICECKKNSHAAQSSFTVERANMSSVLSLEEALLSIKEGSRGKYRKVWMDFLQFSGSRQEEFQTKMPSEEDLTNYFKFLRENKKFASSTLWTNYSMLNSIIKGIYNKRLQHEYPRITSLLKTYDTDIKKKLNALK